MTAFGYVSRPSSPAAQRIYEAGRKYAESLRQDFAREAQEMREVLAKQAAEQLAAECEDRRREMIDRVELAVDIAKTLPRHSARRVRAIMAEVCIAHGISMVDMLGPSRTREVVRARQHAMWLCRQRTRFSLPRLARYFQRDHTTVMHGIAAHEGLMRANGEDI